jgi:aminomethyltransferase
MIHARQSPLHNTHVALGAKLVDFGGWDMPVAYPSGTVAEHLACRNAAAVFDVSHLGTVRVTGPNALASLQAAFTNDLAKIAPGRAQYTHLLNERGGVEDDIIVWWVGHDRFDVMPNASNTNRVVSAIGGVDVTATRAVLAIQGPAARSCVASMSAAAAAVPRFGVVEFEWQGVTCVAAGTGYTGEDGIEVAVPSEVAGLFWEAVVAAGAAPAGLGARDTLRLEAGLPLHGHELGPGITPLQAGLGWVVGWDKPSFRGKAALVAERAAGVTRLLRGITTSGRRPARADSSVLVDGIACGVVTSGNFSPVLEHGIALAFLPPSVSIGAAVQVDVRGTLLDGVVVKPPFVTR